MTPSRTGNQTTIQKVIEESTHKERTDKRNEYINYGKDPMSEIYSESRLKSGDPWSSDEID